jgi:hypothetical protein
MLNSDISDHFLSFTHLFLVDVDADDLLNDSLSFDAGSVIWLV